MKHEVTVSQKQHIIALYHTRSVVALIAGLGVFCVALAAIFWGLQNYIGEESLFHYFTVLSNILAATGAAFMVPYAVEGIRKKRFVLPRWVVLFQYCGAVCLAITMVSTLCFILPVLGAEGVTGMNFWLHLISPTLTVILFQCVEAGVSFTRRDTVIVLIPYWVYMVIYFIMVILVGKENGGWEDIYSVQAYLPVWVTIPMMLLLGYLLAVVLRKIQNRRVKAGRARITRDWRDDMSEVELRVEAFGLGRYMGLHCADSELSTPIDIFEVMAERYGISLQGLTRAFVKGGLDSMEERARSGKGEGKGLMP